jgi:hypothetical protein
MRSSLATSTPSMEKSSEAKRAQVRLGWLDFLLGQAYRSRLTLHRLLRWSYREKKLGSTACL